MGNNITNKRIDELDYIRGFALLGIILVNILALLNIKIPDPNTVDASYQRFLYLFVEGRFFSIFSFLFGVGFYIFITRAIAKGKNGYVLFLRRVVALFIFGLIHQMFQPGEALALYAICGLVVLPFYKAKKEVNVVIGLILTIAFSIMAFKELLPLGLILLGLAAGQYKVFENLSTKIKQVAIFTGVMFVLSVVALWYQYGHVPANPFVNMILMTEDGTMDAAGQFLKIGVTVGPIISAFYVGALILLLQLKPAQTLLAPLKYYGRMALTNYIGQTAMILIAGSVFNFAGNLTYMQTLYVCIAIYAIQIVFSMIWMKIFKMGPLEWIWRVITYWTVTPLKK
ncbi:hypothetical protein COJ27_11080 [Bacillus cereus]|uniref:DUF418 domain-containing protein n=1 Tax=Bacillus cereus TaxID=1396 RepID=A0A9X6VRE8_BACCE|nr:DUF418 domain-containing protein [Bacillus cereus]PFB32820.1 hypothetical protein CN388_00305 [Bacillus cereus]PFC10856.1 hypothetical protein CN284_20360 [Bacillus cereus]PFD25687.1 hypothetical protein CN263_01685 [Bacillus cereus]PFL64586.1 hypothetical protein COJ27_11080 [Bacillus cereus]PGW57807.1 hypothetical protein COE18_26625 [Bacillus cereus]